jgi:ubiquinone/menaquinone biosynthesis C-methylase UbiE/uncharacterized protein YbaR (Trm112 family)
MVFVCPKCKAALKFGNNAYYCQRCRNDYPVILGIPDFRLYPDPYISIEDDRRKGERLFREGSGKSFEDLVRYYYSITPEVPPALAERWTAHAIAQPRIAEYILQDSGMLTAAPGTGSLLDLGCSTAGLLIAAARHFSRVVGVDVAFRWLVIGQARLRQAGIEAQLVCANAEALPFPDGQFPALTMIDVVEHVRDTARALKEARRVSTFGGRTICMTNNRYSALGDPHVGLWGVGYLPRRWQRAYVAWKRPGLKEYCIRMQSKWELMRLFRRAGYRSCHAGAAPVYAPHMQSPVLQKLLWSYNRARVCPGLRLTLSAVGPALFMIAQS